MIIASKLEDIRLEDNEHTCITLGKFDGIHRGHQKLFEMCRIYGHDDILCAFTFDFSIRKVLTGKVTKNLFSNHEKRTLMKRQGVELLVECPFTEEIRTMDPRVFVKEILVKKLHAENIVIGDDFHFGCNRTGDASLLESMAKECGYNFYKVDMVTDRKGCEIGSTIIREALTDGDIELVNELLGFPYFIDGRIIHGNNIGEKIGSPTINQSADDEKLLPPYGVYCSKVTIDGAEYFGVTNIGCKPTVSDECVPGIETYILNFNGKIYGEDVKTSIYHYIRPEKKFLSMSELSCQITRDIEYTDNYWRAR